MLTGFSHGAAGIAYALLRLYALTKEQAYLDAAIEGIAYEDRLLCVDAGNWPDLRSPTQPSFMTSWCHGAPGIGLARLGGLAMLDTGQVKQDIAIALQTAQSVEDQGLASLCCGTLGRAELFLEASHRLAQPELADMASSIAWHVVVHGGQDGRFFLDPRLPLQVNNPAFFQGSAGIGYAFLRLAYPDRLPSVLLWE
jgi:lantibiotic modifying enzyme